MTTTQRWTPTYEQCARLAETGDTDGALEAYELYLQKHPADGRALNDVGTLLYATGRLEESAVYLQGAATRLADRRPFALWNLAEVYLGSRRPAKALGLFDDLHAAGMLSSDLATRTAKAFVDADEPGGAIEALLACQAALPGQQVLGEFVDAIRAQRPKVAFFCDSGDDKFLADIHPWSRQRFPTQFFRGTTQQEMEQMLQWCDVAWFEWCTPQVILATHLPKTCRMIVRLHRYEAFKPWPAQVRWENVDLLVTIGNRYVDTYLRQTVPDLDERTRVVTIPSAVNLAKWPLVDRTRGKNLACFGYVNMRKNPGLLLQCFARLHAQDPEYRLAIGGQPQDAMLLQYLHAMIQELGLQDAVTLEGWIEDARAWLADKHYLISASLGEGLPAGVLEGMASGLKPVIHTWPGARDFFPPQWLWRDADAFCRCILEGEFEPHLYHDWAAERYSLRSQLAQIDCVFSEIERGIRADAAGLAEAASPAGPDADAEGSPGPADAAAPADARGFYDEWYRGAPVEEGYLRRLRREKVVAALAALGRDDLGIINLGCGLGHLEPHLLPFGAVTGVDLSIEAVRAAQRHCPAATFVCGDVRTMLLPGGLFDAVVSVEVIEHLEDADQATHLKRACALLTPGGRLVLTTPNRPVIEALDAECRQRDGRPWSDQPIENWLDAGALQGLAENAGFAIERVEAFANEGDHTDLHLLLVARAPDAEAVD